MGSRTPANSMVSSKRHKRAALFGFAIAILLTW
jgi:hypothetical protein